MSAHEAEQMVHQGQNNDHSVCLLEEGMCIVPGVAPDKKSKLICKVSKKATTEWNQLKSPPSGKVTAALEALILRTLRAVPCKQWKAATRFGASWKKVILGVTPGFRFFVGLVFLRLLRGFTSWHNF